MEYFLLFLLFVVEANAFFSADLNIGDIQQKTPEELEKLFTDYVDAAFENLTIKDICQDCHPSVAIPLEKVVSCVLEQPDVIQSLKEEIVQHNMHSIRNASVEERQQYCDRHRNGYDGISLCSRSVASTSSPEDRKLLGSFIKSVKFIYGIACGRVDNTKLVEAYDNKEELFSSIPTKYQQYLKRIHFMQSHGIKPSQKDYCLPVRVAEGIEMAAIMSQKFPFYVHEYLANAVHFVATVLGGFPFKSFEECA